MTRDNHVAVVLRVAVALDEAASDIIDLPREGGTCASKRVSCCPAMLLGEVATKCSHYTKTATRSLLYKGQSITDNSLIFAKIRGQTLFYLKKLRDTKI